MAAPTRSFSVDGHFCPLAATLGTTSMHPGGGERESAAQLSGAGKEGLLMIAWATQTQNPRQRPNPSSPLCPDAETAAEGRRNRPGAGCRPSQNPPRGWAARAKPRESGAPRPGAAPGQPATSPFHSPEALGSSPQLPELLLLNKIVLHTGDSF